MYSCTGVFKIKFIALSYIKISILIEVTPGISSAGVWEPGRLYFVRITRRVCFPKEGAKYKKKKKTIEILCPLNSVHIIYRYVLLGVIRKEEKNSVSNSMCAYTIDHKKEKKTNKQRGQVKRKKKGLVRRGRPLICKCPECVEPGNIHFFLPSINHPLASFDRNLWLINGVFTTLFKTL